VKRCKSVPFYTTCEGTANGLLKMVGADSEMAGKANCPAQSPISASAASPPLRRHGKGVTMLTLAWRPLKVLIL
jgi:hypothetical protein